MPSGIACRLSLQDRPLPLFRGGEEVPIKLNVQEIGQFQESATFLDKSSSAIYDRFEDDEFKKRLYCAVERIKAIAEKLGRVTISVTG